MKRRHFLGGMFAALAASIAIYSRKALALTKPIASIYPQTKATDEMSDEEWNRIRDEEERAAGWMPHKRGIFIEETKDDRERGWSSLMSDPKFMTPKA